MFIGMIIGAMMAIYSADGPATANQILSNSKLLMSGSQPIPSSPLVYFLIGGGSIWRLSKNRKNWKPLSFRRKSHQPSKSSKN
jgi:hypothetical protein